MSGGQATLLHSTSLSIGIRLGVVVNQMEKTKTASVCGRGSCTTGLVIIHFGSCARSGKENVSKFGNNIYDLFAISLIHDHESCKGLLLSCVPFEVATMWQHQVRFLILFSFQQQHHHHHRRRP